MGDWGDETGDAATPSVWYLQHASDLLDETTVGFGSFVHDLTHNEASGRYVSGTTRGALAMGFLCLAIFSVYRIWVLCHMKPRAYATKPKITH